MAALLPKVAITLLVALAWWRAGAPVEPAALRRRLLWAFGLALVLRLCFALVAASPAGAARNGMALLTALPGLALLWPLFTLVLAGPFTKAGKPARAVLTVVALVMLWWADPGNSMFFFVIALTRCAWPPALRTAERFWASLGALAVGLGLLLGTRRATLSPNVATLEEVAWFARGVGLVFALYASTAAFKAFTTDPTLGVRRVSRRLVLSHVLVLGVPLAIVLALWVSSTYLGVNADRAIMTERALDREGSRLEESLRLACQAADPAAGARAVAEGRTGHWPSLRTFLVTDTIVTRITGDTLPQESKLAGWVAKLDKLPRHGVVDLARVRYLGAAARLDRTGLVALEPVGEAFDSTLSPLMGAEVRMVSGHAGADDSVRATRSPGRGHIGFRRGTQPASLTVNGETVSDDRDTYGFTGYALVQGVQRDLDSWKQESFLLSARASFHASLAGLFSHVRENPAQWVPIVALAFLAFMLLPLVRTDLKMVRGMGGSITRGIRALRDGAEAFGAGRLSHRIPIAGDDDLWDTARQFNLMAEGLERARELEKERDRLENELEVARRIQARLLPAAPPQVAGLDVAGLSESAREVGGDYYDHLDLGGGKLLLVIADVSGKGVPAALLMSAFRAALMSQDLSSAAPEAVAARVNDFLHQSMETGRFVTAFLGLLDAGSGRLTYVNAGHNPPVLLRAGGGVEMLEAGGLILGIVPGSRFERGETALDPGDLVTLYTDGVTEGADAANEQWGEARLLALLRAAPAGPARDVAARIVREVRAFEGERGPADDITVLVAKRLALSG